MSELVDTFSNRLNTAMRIRNIKATELSVKTGIAKSSLSEYINGKYEAKQDGVFLLSKALDVNEAWLMGCDVPMERNLKEKSITNNSSKYSENDDYVIDTEGLTDEDIEDIKKYIEFIKNKKGIK